MSSAGVCHNCGAGGMEPFYQVSRVPAHSVLLMLTRQEAVSCRRGDIVLGVCRRCGFVGNLRHDPRLHEYSERYEETQGFSATFSAFHRELAQDLVERHELRGKTVLEIGCGKGEFLELLCQMGGNRGVGFDPVYVPGRIPGGPSGRAEFVRDYYSERYAGCRADLVCCKMTLEHIERTAEFVRMLRRGLEGQPDTLVFFMVPDASHVLRQAMFWDVYYEHCSYFAPASLAHLFRTCGFDVLRLERAYGGQYLCLEARPGCGRCEAQLPRQEGVARVLEDVAAFARLAPAYVQQWEGRLQSLRGERCRTALWGGSSKSVSFLTTVRVSDAVECVVDINPHKQGTFMPGTGQRIVGPQLLRRYRPDVVILMNPIYREEVGHDLERVGVSPQLLAA